MKIKKRNGNIVPFDTEKIVIAIEKAFKSIDKPYDRSQIEEMASIVMKDVEEHYNANHIPSVEEIQDLVELTLIDFKHIDVVKSYIMYRQKHTLDRKVFSAIKKYMPSIDIEEILREIRKDFSGTRYDLDTLLIKFKSFTKESMKDREALQMLVRAAAELTSKEAPKWEYISGRLLTLDNELNIKENLADTDVKTFYDKIKYMESLGLYGDNI